MNRLGTITKLYLMFIASAFIGWLYEVILTTAVLGKYVDRGMLHLPFCPIYGFGILLLYLCLRKIKKGYIIFLASGVITTVLELAASYILEYGFDMVLWSYRGWPLNFQNRISLISSVIFGLMAVFAFKVIVPLNNKLYNKHRRVVTAVVIGITVIAIVIQIIGMNATPKWKI